MSDTLLDRLKRLLLRKAEGADRRQALRVDTPAHCFVVIEGRQYPLRNWSAIGFLASPYEGELAENGTFEVAISVRQDVFDFIVDARAIVVRKDAAGLAAKIVSVAPEVMRQIEAYFSHHALWVKVNR
ncbi:MAG: PilZ domain-containing protein [Proteobacteria bacterium]|nr:PilZ domain-containing protein [Pseudomonadota bacterium]MBI3496274.1 PilZ domain-containing protein [Pseudomonadota bacterium]